MSPQEYLADRLRKEMSEGQMHATLRDVGRLAGGLLAAGNLTAGAVHQVGELAAELAINKAEAAVKWEEAVEYGRKDPVSWATHAANNRRPDRVLDWGDEISDDYVIEGIDPDWVMEVEEPQESDWNPVAQISLYLTTLFTSEDHVGYCVEPTKEGKPTSGVYTRTVGELQDELARYHDLGAVFGDSKPEVGAWIRFNPLDGQGAKDVNVSAYRYALVESDKVPVEQQRGIYEQLELPIAALVHSGNKSLHAIVRIEAADKREYSDRVDLLYKVCEKNGLVIDRQNKNPSRYSRMPGVLRNGQKQFLVATNLGKRSWSEWEEWVEAINDDLPQLESLSAVWDHLPPLRPSLIDGVLRQGHKMLLSGASKGGKSFALIQLCAAIAEGREWLGWPCAKGRVLYVNLELDAPSCLNRFRAVYEALGWPTNHLGDIDIWNLRGKAVPMDRLAPKLVRRAAKQQYSAVIIDPIYKVITGNENEASQMAHFCNQFDKVCHELGCAVIYCHHHSKGAQGAKRSMDRASGSGVFARDPDALLDLIELVVTKKVREQVGPHHTAWRVEGTFREFPPIEPIDIWFDYPIHRRDTAGLLKDAVAPRDEPFWQRGSQVAADSSAKKRRDREQKLQDAYNVLSKDGIATLAAVANYCDRDMSTIKRWATVAGCWKIDGGNLLPNEEGNGGF